MARVRLAIPDEDHDRFVRQARREGVTLSAWLRTAAYERLAEQQRQPFESLADLEEFFRACDALEGPRREPDWEEHRALIEESPTRNSTSK